MMEFRGEAGYAAAEKYSCAFQSRIQAYIPAFGESGMVSQRVKSVYTDHHHAAESVKLERSSARRAEATCESGWTTYLDQSANHVAWVRGDDDAGTVSEESCREDPSMASDASSGPEQPGFQRSQRKRNVDCREMSKVKAVSSPADDDLDDTCQSNLSCESVSDDPRRPRQSNKRRRVETSVFLNLSASASSEIGDGHSDENDVEVESEEAEICSRPNVNDENAVDTRLEALQELIPNSQKLDGEQVLEVAIDYVKSLETKIKMFEAAKSNRLSHESASYLNLSSNALQDKGLCLFPVSMVAS